MKPVSSWGRLSALPHDVISLNDAQRIAATISGADRPGLAFGMGRSYGDVCLNPDGILWHTTGLNHFISFDDASGRLRCEAGVLLRDIQRLVIPRGWILPVTPGTQMITVGGAIANDVHGKNHHVAGSFGDHVQMIRLVRTDGETITCGPQLRAEWFAATVGGMGLTGVIAEVEIQLQRVPGPWLATETEQYSSLDRFFHLADDAEAGWQHTVSWIDCIAGKDGRGLFMRANPVDAQERKPPAARTLSMPLAPPFSLINRWSLRPFNSAYFNLKKRMAARGLIHFESFYYPLDHLLEWNRMYGPHGFYQYQSVVPREAGQTAIDAMLAEIAQSGQGSFLAVLKTFGQRQPLGMMSFPRPGVTLALDFPNTGASTLRLFERLDAIVRETGGRLYAAKDARMPRDLFEAGYPRLNEFLNYRDPGISSAFSRRLMGS
jgi:FAD/FMN-containing dehydrogenase